MKNVIGLDQNTEIGSERIAKINSNLRTPYENCMNKITQKSIHIAP